LIGQAIMGVWGWRAVYIAFILFALTGSAWLWLRQPETLAPGARRPLTPALILGGLREVLADRTAMLATLVLTLGFGQMFALLSSIQQVFGETFGRVEEFPLWFMALAILSGGASILNARLVMRVGMRKLATRAYLAQALFSALTVAVFASGLLPAPVALGIFFVWATSIFFMAGMTFGNLQSIALERFGHIAGMAASVVTSVSTVGAVAIAAPVGLMFDGTPVPVMAGAFVCSTLAVWLMGRLP
jgi:DHA1 family bicyclomycin/chloramphenicol resistance-like MFS transporter